MVFVGPNIVYAGSVLPVAIFIRARLARTMSLVETEVV